MKKIVTLALLLSSFTLCTAAQSTTPETFIVYLDETEPFKLIIAPSVLNRLEMFKAAFIPLGQEETEKPIYIKNCSKKDFELLITYISIDQSLASIKRRNFLKSLDFERLEALIWNSSMLLLQELDQESALFSSVSNTGHKDDLFEYVLHCLPVDQLEQLGEENLLQRGSLSIAKGLSAVGSVHLSEAKREILKKYKIWPI